MEKVVKIEYLATDTKLQDDVYEYLHDMLSDYAETTLGEIGYLNTAKLAYTNKVINLDLYFLAKLSTEKVPSEPNGKLVAVPKKIFQVFENELFVGMAEDSVTYENGTIPDYTIEKNQLGNDYIVINPDKYKSGKIMILHCNPVIAFAAILDITLRDRNYHVQYATSKNNNKKDKFITTIYSGDSIPANAVVTYTETFNMKTPYDCDDAVPYLTAMQKFIEKKKQEMNQEQQSYHIDNLYKGDKKKKKEKIKKTLFGRYG